jgi:ABC-type multidrug transport system ATPase subunit
VEVLDRKLIEDWQTGEFDFQFFCSPEDLPGDIRPEELATFFCALLRVKEEVIEQLLEFPSIKRNKGKFLADLSLEERSRILLMLAKLKQSKLYLFHNTSRWMGRGLIVRFQALIEELTSRGAGVLYIEYEEPIIKDSIQPDCYLIPNSVWMTVVETIKDDNKKRRRIK